MSKKKYLRVEGRIAVSEVDPDTGEKLATAEYRDMKALVVWDELLRSTDYDLDKLWAQLKHQYRVTDMVERGVIKPTRTHTKSAQSVDRSEDKA